MITLTHLFNILIAKVMVSLQYKCNSQYKNNNDRLKVLSIDFSMHQASFSRLRWLMLMSKAITTSILRMMLDASKRRLTILLIYIVKCFNKHLIIRSQKQSRHFKLAKVQCVDRNLPCHQCAQLPYNATLR